MRSKTVTSIKPVSSSSVMKTTVFPLLIGGRCRAMTIPATRTHRPSGSDSRSTLLSAPISRSLSRAKERGWRFTLTPIIASSDAALSRSLGAGRAISEPPSIAASNSASCPFARWLRSRRRAPVFVISFSSHSNSRRAPIPSNAPALMRFSTIGRASPVRAQNSRSEVKFPPSSRASKIALSPAPLSPYTCASPTRIAPSSTQYRSRLLFTFTGRTSIPKCFASLTTTSAG